MDQEIQSINLKSLLPHITCYLCHGYLIDATTINECLHTFCKSCIVQYLDENNTCPKCDILVHQSHPLQYICYDRVMQDVVYKLVPSLAEAEYERKKLYFEEHGWTFDEPRPIFGLSSQSACTKPTPEAVPAATEESAKDQGDCHRSDEQVNLFLSVAVGKDIADLPRAYVRVSGQCTVTHLKKFVAKFLYSDLNRFREIDILCNQELMGKDHSLKFIQMTRWRAKQTPLELQYRSHIDI